MTIYFSTYTLKYHSRDWNATKIKAEIRMNHCYLIKRFFYEEKNFFLSIGLQKMCNFFLFLLLYHLINIFSLTKILSLIFHYSSLLFFCEKFSDWKNLFECIRAEWVINENFRGNFYLYTLNTIKHEFFTKETKSNKVKCEIKFLAYFPISQLLVRIAQI